LFIGNLGLLTAPIGTSNANGFRFGVDVKAINAEVTTFMADLSTKLGMYFSSFHMLKQQVLGNNILIQNDVLHLRFEFAAPN